MLTVVSRRQEIQRPRAMIDGAEKCKCAVWGADHLVFLTVDEARLSVSPRIETESIRALPSFRRFIRFEDLKGIEMRAKLADKYGVTSFADNGRKVLTTR